MTQTRHQYNQQAEKNRCLTDNFHDKNLINPVIVNEEWGID